MLRFLFAAFLALPLLALPAKAQDVGVAALAAPDAFSSQGRETGLPATLWRGASPEVLRAVLPLLAARPLSPAANRLARRVLATGASGPAGITGFDVELAAARAKALVALGDPQAAVAILSRAPGLERSPALAEAAAEAALLTGDEDRACTLAQGLAEGRTQTYWLRLRTFCQARAGETTAAALTLELAQGQARDAIFGRLMAARLNNTPPGAPSLRNGLDLALSRALTLDLAAAKPAPAVAAALAPPSEPFPPPSPLPADGSMSDSVEVLMGAVDRSANRSNAALARLTGPAGRMPAGRGLALDRAVADGAVGETALVVLWAVAEAGPTGLGVGDRARLAAALARVGLTDDAAFFILEGLAALR